MSFGIRAPTHPGDLDLRLSAWPSFSDLSSPLEVQETIQIPSNGSAPLRVAVQVFLTNVFDVVGVLRPGRGGPRPWSAGAACPLVSCSSQPSGDVLPTPQDILRYTVSSMLLLRLVSPWGGGGRASSSACRAGRHVPTEPEPHGSFRPQSWLDMRLAWNTSVHPRRTLTLPWDSLWTPELTIQEA